MRIGMVTAVYKPVINGVTRMVSLYKERLEAMGHEVFVFAVGEDQPEDDETIIRSPGFQLSDSGYYLTVGYRREAQKMLRQMDILHCHHLFMSVELAHRYGRCPILYTNHTRYDLYGNSVLNLPQPAADVILRQVWPEFCDYADIVVTPSESVRQVMLDFGVRTPIVTIENGVELAPYHQVDAPLTKSDLGIPETAVLLIYVGRLAPEKSVDSLIDQFGVAADIAGNLHLLIVGNGPSREELELQTQRLNLTDRIHFTGVVPFEDVPRYMAAADLFATASVSEVHPLTVIEAMATGLPVVAVSSPGIVDSVENGVTGLLTTRPDGGLAAAMVGLALNDEKMTSMSRAAREISHRFDISRTVELTNNLYERLREERPDLHRKRQHGRRYIYRQKMQHKLNRLFKPTDNDKSIRDWFAPEFWLKDQDNHHDNKWQ